PAATMARDGEYKADGRRCQALQRNHAMGHHACPQAFCLTRAETGSYLFSRLKRFQAKSSQCQRAFWYSQHRAQDMSSNPGPVFHQGLKELAIGCAVSPQLFRRFT